LCHVELWCVPRARDNSEDVERWIDLGCLTKKREVQGTHDRSRPVEHKETGVIEQQFPWKSAKLLGISKSEPYAQAVSRSVSPRCGAAVEVTHIGPDESLKQGVAEVSDVAEGTAFDATPSWGYGVEHEIFDPLTA